MNSIQEALRELRKESIVEAYNEGAAAKPSYETELVEAKKSRHANTLLDLWDQVYCSLTDGGYNNTYKALGKLNGKGKYDVTEVGSSDVRPGFDTIVVTSPKTDAAEEVAKIYGLEYRIVPGKRIYIYVPEGAPVNTDLLTPAWRYAFVHNTKAPTGDASVEDTEDPSGDIDEELNEDVASSMPVTPLPHDDVYRYIENIPEVTGDRPPFFFQVGYIRELKSEIPSMFRGGRASDGQPKVRIFKCSEMTVYTGNDYESLKATKDYRKQTGKERSGERTGFSFTGDSAIVDKIGISARGEEQLQCYIRRGTRPKTKYFISLDDEDLREASKQEVAEYLTRAHADKILGNADISDGSEGAKIVRLKLSSIYRIGNLGHSIM